MFLQKKNQLVRLEAAAPCRAAIGGGCLGAVPECLPNRRTGESARWPVSCSLVILLGLVACLDMALGIQGASLVGLWCSPP